MSTREERAEEAREEWRTRDRSCIGCALGICYDDHDCCDTEDDE